MACIIAGFWLISIRDCQNTTYKIKVKPLKKAYRPFLEDFFCSSRDECIKHGFMDDEEYQEFLAENGVNVGILDSHIKDIKEEIEWAKVEAFDNFLDPMGVSIIKQNIINLKEILSEKFARKFQYYHLSADGQAEIEKNRFSLALSSYWESGKKLVSRKEYNLFPAYILDQVMSELKVIKPNETEIRKMARSEEWNTIMSASKKSKLFSIPITEMLDEQINLINWSLMYQSISQHPEKPMQDIIEDDILLDGWLIKQRKKNEVETRNKTADSTFSEKMEGFGEVFLPAKNQQMAKNIYNLNSGDAKTTVKKNMDYIYKER